MHLFLYGGLFKKTQHLPDTMSFVISYNQIFITRHLFLQTAFVKWEELHRASSMLYQFYIKSVKKKTKNRQEAQKTQKDEKLFFNKNRQKMQTYINPQHNDHLRIIYKVGFRISFSKKSCILLCYLSLGIRMRLLFEVTYVPLIRTFMSQKTWHCFARLWKSGYWHSLTCSSGGLFSWNNSLLRINSCGL